MTVLTPRKYWRLACALSAEQVLQPDFPMPSELMSHTRSPRAGDGVIVADYDDSQQTGLVRWIGIIRNAAGTGLQMDWRACRAQILVNTPKGRSMWRKGHFAFASNKIGEYGLNILCRDHFEGMILRETAGTQRASRSPR